MFIMQIMHKEQVLIRVQNDKRIIQLTEIIIISMVK